MILSIITKNNDTQMIKRKFMGRSQNFFDDAKSILIVEDESILALGMECSLEEFGYEVSGIETTYKSAIEHAKEYTPDLVLMDINLKGEKTGIDAAKYIWRECKIPIVFLTSYSDDKTLQDAVSCEPYGYLIKPCRDRELKAAIETSLHKHNYFFKNKESISSQDTLIKLKEKIALDRAKGILLKDKETIPLTKNELKLFEVLSDHLNESVSFEKISDYIWREPLYDIAKLRALIYRIKKKTRNDIFENIYEYGYMLKSA